MRHVRMLGLCLVAMLALSAYVVSSASALPEWGKCEAKAGGKYSDANCTVKAKKGAGSFEWLKASAVAKKRKSEGKSANVPFSGHNVGSGGTLTTALRECWAQPEHTVQLRTTRQHCAGEEGEERLFTSQFKVECAAERNTGEAVGPNKVGNVHVTFTGCALFGSSPCNSSGKAEGEIETNPLKGTLGYISKSAKEVGVELEPAKKNGEFAKFVCAGALETVVGVGNKKEGAEYASSGCFGIECTATPGEEKHGGYDGIISPITPVNAMTSEYTQVYTQEAEYPYRNIPSKFEGKHIDVLEDYINDISEPQHLTDWSAAGEVITNVNTPEEPGEIKA